MFLSWALCVLVAHKTPGSHPPRPTPRPQGALDPVTVTAQSQGWLVLRVPGTHLGTFHLGGGVLARPSSQHLEGPLRTQRVGGVASRPASPSGQRGASIVQGRCRCLFKREEGRLGVNPRAPRTARPALSGTLSMKPHSGPRLVPTSRGKGLHGGEGHPGSLEGALFN